MQGESAVEGEAIQRLSVREAFCCQIVFPLIEEGPGFLSAERRDDKTHTMLVDLNLFRRFPEEHRGLQIQTFQLSHARIVALDDGPRLEFLNYQFNQKRLNLLRAL